MKKLALLLALLLAFAPSAQAFTFTDADVAQPTFPWGAYTLKVRVYTDDAAIIDYSPAPAEGTLLMLTIASAEGGVALTDIQDGNGQFRLRDAAGTLYEPITWRVRAVTVKENLPVASDSQPEFELVYYLPTGVKTEGLALSIGNTGAADAATVPLPSGTRAATAAAATATPEATVTPAPAAVQDTAASVFVDALLDEQIALATDPWLEAILKGGALDVRLEAGVLRFTLRSFNPDSKNLDFTAADVAQRLYRNASLYNLTCELPVSGQGDALAVTDTETKKWLKTLGKAAAAAKKAFASPKVATALMGMLADDRLTLATAGEYAPLFATQRNAKLTVTGGPHDLTLSAQFADTETLLQKGYDAAYQRLARQGGANTLGESEIGAALVEELTAQAATLRKKSAVKQKFTLDLDTLFAEASASGGEAYRAYLDAYRDAYGRQLSVLTQAAASMPAYPAVEFPPSGWLSGSTSGTRIIFKTPKDGYARYVQMRGSDDDAEAVTLFVQAGKTVTVRVPKGWYYILLAVGDLWYGPEHLFGDSGSYLRTETLEILGSNYYHTITLGGAADGNMSAYQANPSDFQ